MSMCFLLVISLPRQGKADSIFCLEDSRGFTLITKNCLLYLWLLLVITERYVNVFGYAIPLSSKKIDNHSDSRSVLSYSGTGVYREIFCLPQLCKT